MGESGKLMVTTPSNREIVVTRTFDAPRDLVFEAHTSCEHLGHWWGPRKYEIADCEVDFRPGGAWRIVHRAPGEQHVFSGEYREIVRPERISWTFEWGGAPGHVSVDTLTLEERDGVTTVTSTSVFDSVEDRDGMLRSGMEAGLAETWERLDGYLEALRRSAAGEPGS
ncbi:MAG TPA: SRPBCC family protein [Actinomycetota bacterium]|nr:SRPBCC family protein [Actinomycetota bacterium]